jgi:hypothetical protein
MTVKERYLYGNALAADPLSSLDTSSFVKRTASSKTMPSE